MTTITPTANFMINQIGWPTFVREDHEDHEDFLDAPSSHQKKSLGEFRTEMSSKFVAKRNKRMAPVATAAAEEVLPTREIISKAKTRAQRRALDPEPEEVPIQRVEKKCRNSDYWVRHHEMTRSSARTMKTMTVSRVLDED